MALLCCCLGLRISECLALKWSDVDWLNGKLLVERGVVCQNVDDVKTPNPASSLVIAGEIIAALQSWKQATQFSAPDDWIFASPVQFGRLPWSYDRVWRVYQKAAKAAGIGGLGTHSLAYVPQPIRGSAVQPHRIAEDRPVRADYPRLTEWCLRIQVDP